MAANRGTMSESEQQNMEKQPSTASRNGESANKGETWEISSPKPRIMAAIWKFTKENTPNNETIMAEDESTELYRTKLNSRNLVSQLHDAPNSVNEISQATSQVRANFNIYQGTWLLFEDYLTYAGTSQPLESIMNNHKQFVHGSIAQANQCKEEISQEIRSMRSG
jgi:hypothetical protein